MSRLRREDGFTLVEVLVAMMLMMFTLFALYSMFDMSLRVFQFGNDNTSSIANARTAMDRMEREIRSSWNEDKLCDASNATGTLLGSDSSSTQITFYNCFTGSNSPVIVRYSVSGSDLVRQQGSIASPQTLGTAEPVADLGTGGTMTFTYFNATNAAIAPLPLNANVGSVALVKINIVAKSGDSSQNIINNVALRNRS